MPSIRRKITGKSNEAALPMSPTMRGKRVSSIRIPSGFRSDIAPRDRLAGHVAEGETRPDGGAGADRLGADRARHGDAGAVEPADHTAVGPEHLTVPVGARPALGAEADIEEGRGIERPLLDRAQRAVLGIKALPHRLAAMEVAVDTLLRPAVEAVDRGPKRQRVEADLPRQRLDRVGLADEALLLRGEVHGESHRLGIARIEDAPGRQVHRLFLL